MAMTLCPDCQGPVSDAAKACPKCGRPRGKATRSMSNVSKIAFALLFGLAVVYGTKLGIDYLARQESGH